MGPLGVQELIFIFVIALIVFGPRKLPSLGKSLGKSIAEFKRASNELKSTLEQEVKIEETRREIMEPIESIARDAESAVREQVSAVMAEADVEAEDAVEAAAVSASTTTSPSESAPPESTGGAEKVSAAVVDSSSDAEPN